jgi:hypothetical protein
VRIFEKFCTTNSLPCPPEVLNRFIKRCYEQRGKTFRRCQPRDVLTHALNLIRFEGLPFVLTEELLERAFNSCFVEEEDEAPSAESMIVSGAGQSCAAYWADRMDAVPTLFGKLAMLAGFYDRESTMYRDQETSHEYTAVELSRTLAGMHAAAFREWLSLSLEEQRDDLSGYLSTPEGRAAFLSFNQRELLGILTPADTRPQESALFKADFSAVLLMMNQRDRQEPAPVAARMLMRELA